MSSINSNISESNTIIALASARFFTGEHKKIGDTQFQIHGMGTNKSAKTKSKLLRVSMI